MMPWVGKSMDRKRTRRLVQQSYTNRGEVMNPPESAAQDSEARNLNTPQRDGTGAVPGREAMGTEAQATQPSAAPLFIPLKTEYFEAFKAGTKRTEYRVYGPRWNERTCTVGRSVVLSKGYGKANRLQGEITAFWKSSLVPADWEKCYGPLGNRLVAHIRISITP